MAEEKNNIPAQAEKEEKLDKVKIPERLPVLVLRDIVVFPYMIVPLYVGRAKSKKAVDVALNSDRLILLLTQKDVNVEEPSQDQLYQFGTVALIVRMLKLPDGRMRVLIQGISRVRVKAMTDDGKIMQAEVEPVEDEEPAELTLENRAMIKNLRQKFEQASKLGKQISNEILIIAENIEEPGKLADIIASNLELKIEDSQAILEEANSLKRLAPGPRIPQLRDRDAEHAEPDQPQGPGRDGQEPEGIFPAPAAEGHQEGAGRRGREHGGDQRLPQEAGGDCRCRRRPARRPRKTSTA